jgi:probable rRNA maturation factor
MTKRMILISTNHPHLRFPRKEVIRTVKNVYRYENEHLPVLAVIFTNHRFIRNINRQYLDHDDVTDVIAFALGSDGGEEAEIYINLDAARNQAKTYGVPYSQEVRRLLIHGILHILGYDDRTQREKKKMSSREDCYVEKLS